MKSHVEIFQTIIDSLDGVHYGMFNTKLGKVLYSETNPGEINLIDYLQKHGDSHFRILKPDEVLKYKAGTCWDTSLYIYTALRRLKLNPQIVFFVVSREGMNPITHATTVVQTPEGLFNLEYSDTKTRGVNKITQVSDVYKGWDNVVFKNPNINVDNILGMDIIRPQDFIANTGWIEWGKSLEEGGNKMDTITIKGGKFDGVKAKILSHAMFKHREKHLDYQVRNQGHRFYSKPGKEQYTWEWFAVPYKEGVSNMGRDVTASNANKLQLSLFYESTALSIDAQIDQNFQEIQDFVERSYLENNLDLIGDLLLEVSDEYDGLIITEGLKGVWSKMKSVAKSAITRISNTLMKRDVNNLIKIHQQFNKNISSGIIPIAGTNMVVKVDKTEVGSMKESSDEDDSELSFLEASSMSVDEMNAFLDGFQNQHGIRIVRIVPNSSLYKHIASSGGMALISVSPEQLAELNSTGDISSLPTFNMGGEKIIVVSPEYVSQVGEVNNADDIKIAISHEYGHLLTFNEVTANEWSEYFIRQQLLNGIAVMYGTPTAVGIANAVYQNLKPERIANERMGIRYIDMIRILSGSNVASSIPSDWSNHSINKVSNLTIPPAVITSFQKTITGGQLNKDETISLITFSMEVYKDIVPANLVQNTVNSLQRQISELKGESPFTNDINQLKDVMSKLTPEQFRKVSGEVFDGYSDHEQRLRNFFDDPVSSGIPDHAIPNFLRGIRRNMMDALRSVNESVDDLDWIADHLMKESDEGDDGPPEIELSKPKRVDNEEKNKNGVRRKKLYIAFIDWAKGFNPKNTFGSIFDPDAFSKTYPFIPREMRYFYRLANPMLCVLPGGLTFFAAAELRKLNAKNTELTTKMIFAATKDELRVFNISDKKVYLGTFNTSGKIELGEVLGAGFDEYLQKMIGQGNILGGSMEESVKTDDIIYESVDVFLEKKKKEDIPLTPAERDEIKERFGG